MRRLSRWRMATQQMKECRQRMRNPEEWQGEVWHNLYWCWKLQCGPIRLSSWGDKRYHVLISDQSEGTGTGSPLFYGIPSCDSEDPQEAVDFACRAARQITTERIGELQALAAKFTEMLPRE